MPNDPNKKLNCDKTYETEMNDKVFISQLSRVDPEEIIRRGKLDFSTAKYALRFARVILEKYNVGKGSNKLPSALMGKTILQEVHAGTQPARAFSLMNRQEVIR